MTITKRADELHVGDIVFVSGEWKEILTINPHVHPMRFQFKDKLVTWAQRSVKFEVKNDKN